AGRIASESRSRTSGRSPMPDRDLTIPADPAAQSYLSELRAVTADAWRGTSTHPTTAALRATRAGRLALGAVHLGRRLIRADLALMSRAERAELVAEARRRDLIRSWR